MPDPIPLKLRRPFVAAAAGRVFAAEAVGRRFIAVAPAPKKPRPPKGKNPA
jgi:hypothetical protein